MTKTSLGDPINKLFVAQGMTCVITSMPYVIDVDFYAIAIVTYIIELGPINMRYIAYKKEGY